MNHLKNYNYHKPLVIDLHAPFQENAFLLYR